MATEEAIKSYCESAGLHLLQILEDVESGGRVDRKGQASVICNINLRKGWHVCRPVNQRAHSDEEVKLKMRELRDRGTTYQGIANILNELGYLPFKGRKFTESNVYQLMASTKETTILTPRKYCESLIQRTGVRPSYPQLAKLLSEAGYLTPRGNANWWPAQVQQLLLGRFDQFYGKHRAASVGSPDTV